MATFKSNKSVILSSTDDTNGLFGGKNSTSNLPSTPRKLGKKDRKGRTNSLS